MTTENKNIELLDELKEYDFNEEDALNIIEDFENHNDFTLDTAEGEFRFIHEDVIDRILADELSDDVYTLGMFQAWFIADILHIPMDSVEKIQKADCYEALGIMMFKHIEKVAQKYASTDGYGHHFSHYDHSEEHLCNGYYMFRVN